MWLMADHTCRICVRAASAVAAAPERKALDWWASVAIVCTAHSLGCRGAVKRKYAFSSEFVSELEKIERSLSEREVRAFVAARFSKAARGTGRRDACGQCLCD